MSGTVAIKKYFGIEKAADAMREIKSLKEAGYFDWFAKECAAALGAELKQ